MSFPVTNKWVTNKYESIVDSYNCHRKLLHEKQQQVQQCEWVWMFVFMFLCVMCITRIWGWDMLSQLIGKLVKEWRSEG